MTDESDGQGDEERDDPDDGDTMDGVDSSPDMIDEVDASLSVLPIPCRVGKNTVPRAISDDDTVNSGGAPRPLLGSSALWIPPNESFGLDTGVRSSSDHVFGVPGGVRRSVVLSNGPT